MIGFSSSRIDRPQGAWSTSQLRARDMARESRQRRQRLTDKSLGAVRPLLLHQGHAGTDQRDIGTLARIQRFAHKGSAELRGVRVVLEKSRQQIGMAGKHLPQPRQQALVEKVALTRLDPARRRLGELGAQPIVKRPFPWIELERKLDRQVVQIDKQARLAEPDTSMSISVVGRPACRAVSSR